MTIPCAETEGRALMLVATAAAAGIAQGKSIEDVSVIAALLNVIADQLALLAAVDSARESRANCRDGAKRNAAVIDSRTTG